MLGTGKTYIEFTVIYCMMCVCQCRRYGEGRVPLTEACTPYSKWL